MSVVEVHYEATSEVFKYKSSTTVERVINNIKIRLGLLGCLEVDGVTITDDNTIGSYANQGTICFIAGHQVPVNGKGNNIIL